MLLLLPVLTPLIGGIFVFFQKEERIRNRLTLWLLGVTAGLAGLICLLPEQSVSLLTIQGSLGLALRSDGLSRLFLALMAAIWVPVAIFSFPYLKHVEREQQFLGFYTMTLGVLMGLAMSDNFVTLYMFFEMMSLITLPLVLHNATSSARRAGFKYLGFSVFGAGMALAGYFFLHHYLLSPGFTPGGMLDLHRATSHQTLLESVYLLMMVGFGAKAGMMPMQAWLPSAHPVAPAPASAVLSGLITKGGIIAMLRVTYYLFGPDFLRGTWAQEVLLTLALATIFCGSMLALREKQFKRRLAYSTVSQVSYVIFGMLLLSPGGLLGALLQVVFHAVAKDGLFLCAGAIIYSTNFTRVEQLRGIGRRMPVTLWCFTLSALSLIGIPPLAGFVSKWYLAQAALTDVAPAWGAAGVAVLILSALLTAAYLLPIVTRGFFPGKDFIAEHKEVGRSMTGPLVALAAVGVVLGLFPGGLIAYCSGLLQAIF